MKGIPTPCCVMLPNSARRQSVRITGWLLLGLCAVAPAFAQEPVWKPSGETTCQIAGWSIDTDPKGTNVRAAPSAKARVVGKLPAYAVRPALYIAFIMHATKGF